MAVIYTSAGRMEGMRARLRPYTVPSVGEGWLRSISACSAAAAQMSLCLAASDNMQM